MMTKTNYQAVADKFRDEIENSGNDFASHNANYIIGMARGIETMAEAMADVFAADNPRFNRKLFLDACGMGV